MADPGRQAEACVSAADVAALWRPRFPSPQLVGAAAAMFPARPAQDGHTPARLYPAEQALFSPRLTHNDPLRLNEGPRHQLVISPGVLALQRRDVARRERTLNRQIDHHTHRVDQLGFSQMEGWAKVPCRRAVREWSRKSRCRMTRRLAELDWTPLTVSNRLPAMLTLTYPGQWEAVASAGPVVKTHLLMLFKRWERAWSEPFTGAWKLEFQSRGAPHFHLYCCPPLVGRVAGEMRRLTQVRYRPAVGDGLAFHQWLSVVWADIVNHPDPEQYGRHLMAGTGVDIGEGMRGADPKRIAVYFTKHGLYRTKEYQHEIPAPWQVPGKGPGRFWGYRVLRPATVTVELDPGDYDRLARTLRRYVRAQGLTREVWAPRSRASVPESAYPDVIGLAGAQLLAAYPLRKRRVRRRKRYLRSGAGFVCVNDAPGLAGALSRVVQRQ